MFICAFVYACPQASKGADGPQTRNSISVARVSNAWSQMLTHLVGRVREDNEAIRMIERSNDRAIAPPIEPLNATE